MSNDDKPIPLSRFVEWFAAHQRRHYDNLLGQSARHVAETMDLDDETQRLLIAEQRRVLDADL